MAARFLLVHANSTLSVRIRRVLADAFHTEAILEALGDADARRLLLERPPDLVLVDLDVGSFNSPGLFSAGLGAGDLDLVPVIVLIPEATEARRLELLRSVATDFVLKPFTDMELVARVRLHYRAKVLADELRTTASKLEALVVLDDLTGLYKEGHLMTILAAECRRFVRYKTPVSLVLLEIDGLDRIAAAFGRQKNEDVLRRVSQVVAASVRSTDWVARSADQRFAVVLPHTDAKQAAVVIDRLRKGISALKLPMGGGLHRCSASFGLAGCDERSVAPGTLVERAFLALRTT